MLQKNHFTMSEKKKEIKELYEQQGGRRNWMPVMNKWIWSFIIVIMIWTILPCHMNTHEHECSTCWLSILLTIHMYERISYLRDAYCLCVHVSSFSPASFISIFINCDSECKGCWICLIFFTLMLVYLKNLCRLHNRAIYTPNIVFLIKFLQNI